MSKPNSLEYKVSFNLDREMMGRIERVVDESKLDQATVLRAMCRAGLPTIEDLLGLIPMLQPGVLKTSSRKEYNGNTFEP